MEKRIYKSKILFVYDSRVARNQKGEYFTKSRTADPLYKRYKDRGDLTVITSLLTARKDQVTNEYDKLDEKINIKIIPYLRKLSSLLSYKKRKETRMVIKQAVMENDKIIIRVPSDSGYLTYLECKKQRKEYLVEVVGNAFDAFWNHSFAGKIIANNRHKRTKKIIADASFAIYVTKDYLQKVYPTKGKWINASNVELKSYNMNDLEKRLNKISNIKESEILNIATSAALNVRFKGQHKVISILHNLKKKGIIFNYYLWGGGPPKRLVKLIKKHNMQEQVHILGLLPNEEVQTRLRDIDIYIQPSKQEGLPRGLIEAMSKGCLCFGTNIAGIPELLEKEFMFSPKRFEDLKNKLLGITIDEMATQAKTNFSKSKLYIFEALENKRQVFIDKFINS